MNRLVRNIHFLFSGSNLYLSVAFLATLILSLLPFFSVGFTTSDDLQYFLTAQQPLSYWAMDHYYYAVGQGRFYFLISKWLYYIPYLIDNFAYSKAVQYLSLVVAYLLFAYLTYKLFHSKVASALVFLLLVVNTSIVGMSYFIAVTSYPFFFSFSWILFMLGILLLINHYQRGSKLNPLWAALFFLLASLFYENYLVFASLVLLVMIIYLFKKHGFKTSIRSSFFYRDTLPILLYMVIYTLFYVGYRRWVINNIPEAHFYGGALLSDNSFSLSKFFRVIFRCTMIALPGENYFQCKRLIAENSLSLSGHHNNPLFIFSHASVRVCVNALLQACIFFFLAKRVACQQLKYKRLLIVALLALLFAFSAQGLIAVTPKYQEWSHWLKGYVTSFYSYFGFALVFTSLIVCTLLLTRHHRFAKGITFFWTFLLFFLSMIIGFANDHLAREWKRSQNRFSLLDAMAKYDSFQSIPDDAILYIEGLHKLSRTAYSICEGTGDIGKYIIFRSGRDFLYAIDSSQLRSACEQFPDRPVCSFFAKETQKAGELLLSFSCQGTTNCFYLSPTKQFTTFYQSDGLWHQQHIVSNNTRCPFSSWSICDSLLDPQSIFVSNLRSGIDY